MLKVYLNHINECDEGTLGTLSIPSLCFACYTIELPWRDNKQSVSRIPMGEYICKLYNSPKYGKVFMIRNVENRSYILFHAGNFAGDITKGYRTDSRGCIILGKKPMILGKQLAVISSRPTLAKFTKVLSDYEQFKLIIT